jgi:hypothetical protein
MEEGEELLGTIVGDRYDLRAVLASGAQALVFRA